jgi:Rrf2 family transcriptional regulator, nitric oxide-sensitive transcriptional repressor
VQLTNYTDYALRTLMALAVTAPQRLTVKEISGAYAISGNHLLKVVQRLADLGYVVTVRGKNGGVELAREPRQISIGQVVRELEPELGLVECLRAGGDPCSIVSACRLKGLLREASRSFFSTLDGCTLADLMTPRPKLEALLQLRKSS